MSQIPDVGEKGVQKKEQYVTRAVDGKPAVGIVATGENDDEVARVCLRAHARDHEVFIAYEKGTEPNLLELDKLKDITVIQGNIASYSVTDHDNPTTRLEVYARTNASGGLIIVEDTSIRVDFQKSLNEIDSETHIARAIPEPASGVQRLIAIPAYNESKTIDAVVERSSQYADEVLVINDGSGDNTAMIAEQAGATVISHELNRGYGAALRTAFERAETWNVNCLVIIDGDGQHDVSDIPTLCSNVENGESNVAIGSRFAGDAKSDIPLYRRFGIGVVNTFSNVSMGMFNPRGWVSDTQSGFRAYDKHAIEELANTNIGDDMDASLDILYKIQEEGFEITEEATIVDYDVENGHSQNPVKHGIRLVSTILRTVERDHPVKMLGIPGFVLTFVGLVFGYMTVANYLASQTFSLGFALISAFFILLGVFSAFAAMMLHSLQLHLNKN